MTRARAISALKRLGFQFDWSVTIKHPVWGSWTGTIDPTGRMSIGGDCRGIVVDGDTASAMYDMAVDEARSAARLLVPCTDPDCDYHADQEDTDE